jgi:hypothetical protein
VNQLVMCEGVVWYPDVEDYEGCTHLGVPRPDLGPDVHYGRVVILCDACYEDALEANRNSAPEARLTESRGRTKNSPF